MLPLRCQCTLDVTGKILPPPEIAKLSSTLHRMLTRRGHFRPMKRLMVVLLVLLAAVVGIPAIPCWIAAEYLVMPPRRPLLEKNRTALAEVSAAGIAIREARTDGGVPFLVCEPVPLGRPGKRGSTLRHELLERGVDPGDYGKIVGTMVLLHGWGARKENLLRVAERFCAAGLRCVIPDLPGHGDNPVSRTGFGFGPNEATLAADVLDAAAAEFGFPAQPAVLWGMSMGGSYAIAAAAEQPSRWKAMVVVSSFDALAPVVREQARKELGPWAPALQPWLVLITRFRGGVWISDIMPARLVRRTDVPAMFVHGDLDTLIPIQAGRRLHDEAASPVKRWVPVKNAAHGNVLGTPQQVFAEMAAWLLGAVEAGAYPDISLRPVPDGAGFALQCGGIVAF